jgi:putative PIN family toxin of toxin-antitoxin system
MMRVVLDANIIISGIGFPNGLQSRILHRRIAGGFHLLVSDPLVQEVRRTLSRTDFSERYRALSGLALTDALAGAEWIEINRIRSGIATHPEDDVIVATAVLGNAELLVTGDRQLLKLGRVEGVRIVDSRMFLEMLNDEA